MSNKNCLFKTSHWRKLLEEGKDDINDVKDFIKQHAAEKLKVLKSEDVSEPEDTLDAAADGRDWQPTSQRPLRKVDRLCRLTHVNRFEQLSSSTTDKHEDEHGDKAIVISITEIVKPISLNKLRKDTQTEAKRKEAYDDMLLEDAIKESEHARHEVCARGEIRG